MMWSLAVIAAILCIGTSACVESSHHKQESENRLLMDVTIPRRLDLEYSNTGHASRIRRDTEQYLPDSKVAYSILVFGQDLILNLTRDSTFISPQVIILRQNETRPLTSDVTECFYSGQINEELTSSVNVNLCEGMRGRLLYSGGDYLIEPHSQDSHLKAVHHKRHTIVRSNPTHQGDFCGSDGHEDVDTSHQRSSPHTTSTKAANQSTVHSRSKRSYSHEHFVEVMLVADTKMSDYHGNKLEHYLLTLMSIVNNIYKHASIGNNINIVIVKLFVIEEEKDGPKISSNAAATLRDFCEWQSEHNTLDDNHIYHHDTAILITKNDICRSSTKCDTLGLAELGRMCDPSKSCSIVEDNGLSAAFTIAHELGHTFNLPHDDSKKCPKLITGKPKMLNVMAPTLDFNSDPWTWSQCSSLYMTEFLDSGNGNCLLDKPPVHKYDVKLSKASTFFPGEFYSATQQCQLVFGKQSKVCSYMPVCRRLWCTNLANGCRTHHMPWADGTKCGASKWCLGGECVYKRRKSKPVDGGWSSWEDWGTCSRPCGGGIRASVRKCDNPRPSNSGKYCIGRRVRYKSCNFHECAEGTQSFREQQCSEYNGKHFNINGLTPGVRWVPKYAGVSQQDRCKLYCRASSSSSFYRLAPKVKDGTKCGPDTNNMCVNGVCRRAGCDNRLGSNVKFDRCGVCGGDNSSCRTIEGSFNKRGQYGYNYVVALPKGALNIEISQTAHNGKKDDSNYLALGVVNTKSINSRNIEYILNGDFVVNIFPRDFVHHGIKIAYSGSGVVETLNITHKLKDRFYVMVLSVGDLNPPNIRYKYVISTGNTVRTTYSKPRSRLPTTSKKLPFVARSPTPDSYLWSTDVGEWGTCNNVCQGFRERRVTCVRKTNRQPVTDSYCKDKKKPAPLKAKCNTGCTISWNVVADPRAVCSVTCGTGVKKQRVLCVKRSRTEAQILPDKRCTSAKPKGEVACRGKCVPGKWSYSSWSSCTVTCGAGVIRRQATCTDINRNKVEESRCKAVKIVEQVCNDIPCPLWIVDKWNKCSVSCGVGTVQRSIMCSFEDTKIDDKFCANERPATEKPCDSGACPTWSTSDWTQCGTSCGEGLHQRVVQCVASKNQVLPDNSCDITIKPSSLKSCMYRPCPVLTTSPPTTLVTTTIPPTTIISTAAVTKAEVEQPQRGDAQWRTGSWTPCSSTCGTGIRARYVSCRTNVGGPARHHQCAHTPKPESTEECMVAYCGNWRVGDWSQCSSSCGEGTETRLVGCIMLDEQLHEGHCNIKTKPVSDRQCNQQQCIADKDFDNVRITTNDVVGTSHWRIGPWGPCSLTCGNGWQRRRVICHNENGPDDKCDVSVKPDELQKCRDACPVWSFGGWGQCSETCGDGHQSRAVVCRHSSGKTLADDHCNIIERPKDSQACRNSVCPPAALWQAGKWSRCSVTCGSGQRTRQVTCVTEAKTTVDEAKCKNDKPRVVRGCRKGKCPRWTQSSWSECSVSCGEGRKLRRVWCTLNGTAVEPKMCSKNWPRNSEKCFMTPCPTGQWKAEKWSKCSVTCGKGVRHRSVVCIDKSTGEQMSAERCPVELKPKMEKRCRRNWCPFMWLPGNWSQCSETCGGGVQSRNAACHRVTPEGWLLTSTTNGGCHDSEKPMTRRRCNTGQCDQRYFWRTGDWQQCSSECGWGKQRRRISCMTSNGNRKGKAKCDRSIKPTSIQSCYSSHCYVSSCKELKFKNKINRDGEYRLQVRGKLLKIYCRSMKTKEPQEYVSLPTGYNINFANIYSKRLTRPNTCPYGGGTPTVCEACSKRLYPHSGYTIFSKIRFNVTTMQVITNDFTFSTTVGAKQVPFGSGGDCYSSADCPQGGFHIDLSGTGLKVSTNMGWYTHGHKTVQKIRRMEGGVSVHGSCGGYCGACRPRVDSGLLLDIVES